MIEDKEVPLNIKVSGHSVYKAVSNYLKNDPKMKQKIEGTAIHVLESEAMQKIVEKCVKEKLQSYLVQEELRKQIKKEIKEQLANFDFQNLLKAQIKQSLSSLIVG